MPQPAQHATAQLLVPTSAIDTPPNAPPRVWLVTNRAGNRGTLRAIPIQRSDHAASDPAYAAITAPIPPGALIVNNPRNLTERQAVRIATATRDGAPS